jgi:hypothetical protein
MHCTKCTLIYEKAQDTAQANASIDEELSKVESNLKKIYSRGELIYLLTRYNS